MSLVLSAAAPHRDMAVAPRERRVKFKSIHTHTRAAFITPRRIAAGKRGEFLGDCNGRAPWFELHFNYGLQDALQGTLQLELFSITDVKL